MSSPVRHNTSKKKLHPPTQKAVFRVPCAHPKQWPAADWQGKKHCMHPTQHLHTAIASRQVRLHTAIFPTCPGSLHFQFSKFKHNCLSVQSPVSPFPHGTCSLLVSDKRLALDQHYHLFRTPIQRGTTQRKCTICWGLQLMYRVCTITNTPFQKFQAAPLLAAPLKATS